jgi:hypothetical protein
VAGNFGIAPTRVLQIVVNFKRRYICCKGFLPVLDRVLRFVARRVPANADLIEKELQVHGLTLSRVPLEQIFEGAEWFGLLVPCGLAHCNTVRLVAKKADISVVSLILKHVRRAIARFGLVSKVELREELAKAIPTGIDPRLFDIVLSAMPGYEYLGQGWFRAHTVGPDPFFLLVRKVLCVAPRIHVLEMCDAIAGDPLRRRSAPPKHVMFRFCRNVAGCEIKRQVIIARGRLDPSQILGSSELAVLDAFRTHGPLLSRKQLEEHCAERGISRHSLRVYALRSPIVSRYAKGVYRLRGTEIPK